MQRVYRLITTIAIFFCASPPNDSVAQDNLKKQDRTPKFSLSTETTFLTKPIRKDGFVDYAGGINERLRKGITSKNNSCIDLHRALGPSPEGLSLTDTFFSQLGMERPQAGDNYLKTITDLNGYRNLSEEKQDELLDQLFHAMYHPWKREDYPKISSWLDQNEKPLKFILSASQHQNYFSPLVVESKDSEIPSPLVGVFFPGPQASREAARLLCVRAMLKLEQGNPDAAWEDLLACKRLGRLIGLGPTTFESLIGAGLERLSHDAMIKFIEESQLTSKQVNGYQTQLKCVPSTRPIYEKIALTERCMVLDALGVMSRKRKEELNELDFVDELGVLARIVTLFDLDIDLDPAYRACNQKFNRLTKIMKMPEFGKREELLRQFRHEEDQLIEKIENIQSDGAFKPTRRRTEISKLLGEAAATNYQTTLNLPYYAIERTRQNAVNIDVALSLAAYHTVKGHYPKDLEALEPDFLSDKPVDYFSGKDLIYRRSGEGYVLYSVGYNMKDESGRSFEDDPQGDDLCIRINTK